MITQLEQEVARLKNDERTYRELIETKREEFHNTNAELFGSLEETQVQLLETTQQLKEVAMDEYERTGNNKPSEFTSVKIFKQKPQYAAEKALDWCKKNMPVAIEETVNSKMFEAYPKLEELDFVTIPEPEAKVQISQKL